MTKETKTQENAKKPIWQLAIVFISSFAILFVVFFLIFVIILAPHPKFTASPVYETKSLLADLVDKPGALKHTKEAMFQPGDVLAASVLVKRLPISKDQVCMSTGEFEEDKENGFECIGCEEGSSGQRIVYHGQGDKSVKIAIICNINRNELLDDIDAYQIVEYEEGTSIKTACEVCPEDGKCCAIILKRS